MSRNIFKKFVKIRTFIDRYLHYDSNFVIYSNLFIRLVYILIIWMLMITFEEFVHITPWNAFKAASWAPTQSDSLKKVETMS